jgi:hypothetical protein
MMHLPFLEYFSLIKVYAVESGTTIVFVVFVGRETMVAIRNILGRKKEIRRWP